MTSESSAGFHPNRHPHHGGLFAPGGATSSSSSGGSGGVAANYNYGGGSMNLGGNECPGGIMLFGAQNSINSSLTHVLDSFPGLKHDGGFAVEWSVGEQYKLEEGLAKYASEHNITKYVKIAASLRDKTVRDVALRCRWMMRKRRKQEHPCLGKKIRDRKTVCVECFVVSVVIKVDDVALISEKMVEPALKTNMSSASSVNVAPYTSTANQQCGYMISGVLSGTARHLLEENSLSFEQISVNLSTQKLQQNIDLFFHVRNNIITVLDSMTKMPGIMSQMPPLPVFLNEELTSSIFLPSSQFGCPALFRAERDAQAFGQIGVCRGLPYGPFEQRDVEHGVYACRLGELKAIGCCPDAGLYSKWPEETRRHLPIAGRKQGGLPVWSEPDIDHLPYGKLHIPSFPVGRGRHSVLCPPEVMTQ
ncbi:hypothetical protein SASPL_142988 [Salvia splendens]|uniref:Myb-like domain-containing protein n=1 Tax=Salvia splendens TaxID=180675 RepID=A0A8X8WLB3_SALSN|nr:hypothetical protein SASPL_142988 [Salvia splendens]